MCFKKNSDFSICHIYRECRRVAEYLTNFSFVFSLGFYILDKVPKGVNNLISLDCTGMTLLCSDVVIVFYAFDPAVFMFLLPHENKYNNWN